MASKWFLVLLYAGHLLVWCTSNAGASVAQVEYLAGREECFPSKSFINKTELEGGSHGKDFNVAGANEDIGKDDKDDEDFITEATPPFNQTFPAPKTTNGFGNDLGEPQELDPTYSESIFERVQKASEYMQSKVMVEDLYKEVRSICRNEHRSCAFWAVIGECDNNPAWMHVNCAPVCETCEVRNVLAS